MSAWTNRRTGGRGAGLTEIRRSRPNRSEYPSYVPNGALPALTGTSVFCLARPSARLTRAVSYLDSCRLTYFSSRAISTSRPDLVSNAGMTRHRETTIRGLRGALRASAPARGCAVPRTGLAQGWRAARVNPAWQRRERLASDGGVGANPAEAGSHEGAQPQGSPLRDQRPALAGAEAPAYDCRRAGDPPGRGNAAVGGRDFSPVANPAEGGSHEGAQPRGSPLTGPTSRPRRG
jgi:hypothetical protein